MLTLETLATRVLPRVSGAGRVLARSEWRTLAAAAAALVAGGPHGISAEDVADNVERFLVAGRSRRAWRVRVLLTLIEIHPLSLRGYRRRFSALTRAEQRAIAREHWAGGRGLGRICGKVKHLVVLGAYGDPRAAARTGYVPVPSRRRLLEYVRARAKSA